MIRWADLTLREQADFGNGCGLAWMPRWLVNLFFGWFFEASCRRHDFGYARGGSRADRYAVDVGFYASMRRDARLAPFFMRHFLLILAWLFFVLVRLFGWWRFNYGAYQPWPFLLGNYKP